jgi:broad specificity phosphatase PhoE
MILSLLGFLAQGLSWHRGGLVFASGRNGRPATVVFLLRHAEKDTVATDPPLSTRGRERAVALARLMRKTRIAAIYATQYIRTQQTVRPLCDSLGLRSTIMNVDRDSLEQDAHTLSATILRFHRGDTVLVCGHSNTLPLIMRAFGVGDTVSIADTEYDALFLLTIPDSGKPSLARRRFGR